jgi:hypothetical protein
MIHRRIECIGIALVLILASATLSPAKEVGALTVLTDLNQNTAIVNCSFMVNVHLNYQGVDGDKIVGIRITPLYEPDNPSMTYTDQYIDPYGKLRMPFIHEENACDLQGKNCKHDLLVDFTVAFTKEIIPENWIQIDGYVRTADGKSFHILDTYILKVKMIPKSRLEINEVDCPRPPDTVRVGEKVPFRMKVQCISLLPESVITGTIQAVSGGNGIWTWKSPKMSGSSLYVSQPLEVTFNQPGRWKLQAKAKSGCVMSEPYDFEVEVVKEPDRIVGPVRIGYPKLPDTVREGEKVRFDVSMDYKNFPPGTVGAVVFVDPATGENLPAGDDTSRMLSGNGTYDFAPILLRAPAPGIWHLNVTIRLPQKDNPNIYETAYAQPISLKVLSEASAPAWNPAAMTAEITRIQKPEGTLELNEIFPIFVTVSYDNFGEQGAVLRADATEKGTTIFAGRSDSILLRNQGTYTFPVINVKASHTGTFSVQVEIAGPDSRVLATKSVNFTVVD